MPDLRVGICTILFTVICGCADSSRDSEFHAIDKFVAAPTDGLFHSETQIEGRVIENQAMMSILSKDAMEPPASALEVANPKQIELLVPSKIFLKDRQTAALRLTFDDLNLLTVLNMDPVIPDAVSYMPDWLRSLDGQLVRIRGFMLPTYETTVERFVLLRDNKECCYGPGAKIYDNIDVRMKPGTRANYVSDRESLDVVGRLRIQMEAVPGHIIGLYVIEDAAVIAR